MRRYILLISLAFLMTACAMQQRIAQTPSGRPEIDIATEDVEAVKGEIVYRMQQHGFFLNSDTSYTMNFTKTMTGGQAMFAQMLIGNSYSTTPQSEVNFNITKRGGSVHVIAFMSMSTQMAMGQVNRQDMAANNNWFNDVQGLLNETKTAVEAQKEQAPKS